MKKLRDFRCQECDHRTEKYVEDDERTIVCEECASMMQRMLSAPKGYGNAAHGGLKTFGGFN